MRIVAGLVLLIAGALPLPLVPVVVFWAIEECGPANSSCHHPPFRFAAFLVACPTAIGTGLWMLVGPRRRPHPPNLDPNPPSGA